MMLSEIHDETQEPKKLAIQLTTTKIAQNNKKYNKPTVD